MSDFFHIVLAVLQLLGIVVGALAVIVPIAAVMFFLVRKGLVLCERKLHRSKEEETNIEEGFCVVCPVCQAKNWFQKAGVMARLDSAKPLAGCERCHANISAVYIEHAFVKNAQREFDKLKHRNELTYALLQELHKDKPQALPVTTASDVVEEIPRLVVPTDILPPYKPKKRSRHGGSSY